jgi:hypothetical protein
MTIPTSMRNVETEVQELAAARDQKGNRKQSSNRQTPTRLTTPAYISKKISTAMIVVGLFHCPLQSVKHQRATCSHNESPRTHARLVLLTLPVVMDEVHLVLHVVDHYNELAPSNVDVTYVSGTLQWNIPRVARLLARAYNALGPCATLLKRFSN